MIWVICWAAGFIFEIWFLSHPYLFDHFLLVLFVYLPVSLFVASPVVLGLLGLLENRESDGANPMEGKTKILDTEGNVIGYIDRDD